jgi:hypothetical protein
MNKMFADREHLGSVFRHGTSRDMDSGQLISPSETYLSDGFLPSNTALIREKTTLLFQEYSILVLIWLIRG